MILFIDTSDSNYFFTSLIKNKKIISSVSKKEKGERLLFYIDEILKNDNIKKIKGILVVNKNGGFTSLRMGVAVANALAYFLKIPIAGIKKNETRAYNLLYARPSTKIYNFCALVKNLEKFYKKLKRKIVLAKYEEFCPKFGI